MPCGYFSSNIEIIFITKDVIRLEIAIEIRLEFNQLEERKLVSSLINFDWLNFDPISISISSLITPLNVATLYQISCMS